MVRPLQHRLNRGDCTPFVTNRDAPVTDTGSLASTTRHYFMRRANPPESPRGDRAGMGPLAGNAATART
ncbi:MAG: hypothetical protein HY287_02155 [Planctomycetes bacterium]|nr:hypothetical protein [Planctomycetota bacterium]MBI3833114.1 hypothetical protein [Planctomycetota bacterium]